MFKPGKQLKSGGTSVLSNTSMSIRQSMTEKATIKLDKNSEENEKLRSEQKTLFRRALFVTIAFMSLGVITFCASKGWTFINALYFVVVTLTTVGFGDQSSWEGDLDDGTLLFMSFYALLGIMLVGSALGIIAASLVEESEHRKEEAMYDPP
jgi:hypothetical protein